MKLAILVNRDIHLNEIIGITGSAVSKGHEVEIFVMDQGTKLLEHQSFVKLIEANGAGMCYCNYNVERLGISKELVSDDIVCGSQYDNAVMMHDADKVIVL